ncbi:MAG TPA: hypothetical protein VEX68_19590 [Bryobacteraceae bacterium]|nr:hypothetical protein [Bryobacteraceae bacterium]
MKRLAGIFAALLCVFAAAYLLLKPSKRSDALSGTGSRPKVSVSISKVLKARSRDSGSGFWIAYGANNGDSLSPTNLAVYVRAKNNTGDPVKLGNHSAAMNIDGKWVELTRIPFSNTHTPYFGFSPDALQPLIAPESKTGSVSLEVNTGAAVPPKTELEGWAIFEYPENVGVTDEAAIRVSLAGESGETFTTVIDKSDLAALSGIPINVGGRIDLSRLTVGWYSKIRVSSK